MMTLEIIKIIFGTQEEKILVEPPLDLPIKVHGRKFTTNLFDVKDVFVSFHY